MMASRQSKIDAGRRYREVNPERSWEQARASMVKRRRDSSAAFWFKRLENRAKKAGLEFDLTVEFLQALFAPMTCSVTGAPLSANGGHGKARQNPGALSVDRIGSDLGYIQGNVRLMRWAYNLAKGPWDDPVVRIMARARRNG